VGGAAVELLHNQLWLPLHETPLLAVGIGYQDFSAEGDAPENDEVSALGEVSGAHKGYQEIAARQGAHQGVRRPLLEGDGGETAFSGKSFHDGEIGAAPLCPVPQGHRQLGHLEGIGIRLGHAADHHGHGRGTAAVAANIIGSVGLFRPGLAALIEIDNRYGSAGQDFLAVDYV